MSDKDCAILHAEPRMLLVRISHPAISMSCLVAHAPHAQLESKASGKDCWREVRAVLSLHLGPTEPILLLTDANAHEKCEQDQGHEAR